MNKSNSLWHTVFYPYLTYVALFLGIGLISGGIVHMPMDPVRYTLVMLAGVVMFGFSTFVNDLRQQESLSRAGVIRALLFSLLLSVGIGMISGGIQHFSDNPTYSAALIPIGFSLSLFSFVLKNRIQMSLKRGYALILLVLLLLVPMKVSINYFVESAVQNGGGNGHGH